VHLQHLEELGVLRIVLQRRSATATATATGRRRCRAFGVHVQDRRVEPLRLHLVLNSLRRQVHLEHLKILRVLRVVFQLGTAASIRVATGLGSEHGGQRVAAAASAATGFGSEHGGQWVASSAADLARACDTGVPLTIRHEARRRRAVGVELEDRRVDPVGRGLHGHRHLGQVHLKHLEILGVQRIVLDRHRDLPATAWSRLTDGGATAPAAAAAAAAIGLEVGDLLVLGSQHLAD